MGDGTVQDCRTGLIWLKNADCGDTINGIASSGYLSLPDAFKWVEGLQSGSCGLTDGSSSGDWRLPTKAEWMAMVAYAKSHYSNPALTDGTGTAQWTNGNIFNNVQLGYYWASTPYAPNNTEAWAVQMSGGSMAYGPTTGSVVPG